MKNLKIFVTLFLLTFSIAASQAQSKVNTDIHKIIGNWANKNSNSWELGFFEDFAIYKGAFWNYKTLKFNGSSANIVLNRGSLQTNIQLQIKNEKLCEIAINDKPAELFFKCYKNLPSYSTPDHTAFKTSQFQKVDTVTITGYFRNNSSPKPFSVSFMDPIKDDQTEYFADLDSLGRFTLKFPLSSATHLFVDWGRMTKMDVIEPGENYFLFFDFSNQQHLIMGDNERLHNELAAYETYIPTRDMSKEDYLKMKSLETMDFLKLKKVHLQNSEMHLNQHLEENPFVSEKFKYFVQSYYKFSVAYDLMQRRFSLARNSKEKFPEGFMEYVSDTLYKNKPVQPFTLVREYLAFMRDYIGYAQDLQGATSLSLLYTAPILYLVKAGRLKMTEEENKLLLKWDELTDVLFNLNNGGADSTTRAEAAKPIAEIKLKIDEIYQRELVQNFVKQEWPDIVSAMFTNKIMDKSLTQFDELITDSLLKDVFEAQKFYWLIDYKKAPLSKEMNQIFQERVSTPVFVATIEKLNRHYSQLNKQDIFYTESLKNTDHLKDAKDADALFRQLTEPYRGKVVYIDFWGSWCGPCKQQMPYAVQAKEALKGKDVIFMYFANRSPETTWKNIIKENKLSGENVVHYRLPDAQQAMIERRLSVRSFPTYILMDKKGNIVNMHAPRPQEKEQLVNEITKLL